LRACRVSGSAEGARAAAESVLSDARSVVAYCIFFASYCVFALGKFPGLKIDRPGAAIIGAVLMVAFRIMTAQQALSAIDFSTIVLLFSMTLIIGLFIIVGGAERAGLTARLLQPFLAWNLHRVWTYSALTALLSNIVSNVPAVVLLKSLVTGFPDPQLGWLTLAMSSTLAGNLTITGSVANIIVVERARPEVHIGFRDYFRLGLPLTLLTLTWGIIWLSLSA
jgi:Na+/H+ antiporter NhaD/arsenite permease-like protein